METRPLTDRELENAMIALFKEVDKDGKHCLPNFLGHLMLVDGTWRMKLPTSEGVFL